MITPAIDRRSFLRTGAAALGGMACSSVLLAAAPPASAPITVEEIPCDAGSLRRASCFSPSQDGSVELGLNECEYPDSHTPGTVWVDIVKDASFYSEFGAYMTSSEIDALIANLSALRDRARKEGLLAPSVRT